MSETNTLYDGDYILADGKAWFDVNGFVVRIYASEVGLKVSVLDPVSMEEDALCDPMQELFIYSEDLKEKPND